MHTTTQRHRDPLDLYPYVRVCRGCGMRGVVCAYARCTTCDYHSGRGRWAAWGYDAPVHLCCGWWGPLSVLPWTCLTCGALRTRKDA